MNFQVIEINQLHPSLYGKRFEWWWFMKSDQRSLQKKAFIVTSEDKKIENKIYSCKNSNVSLLLANYSEFTMAWMYKWEENH